MSDMIKPRYTVICKDLKNINLNIYDIIIIPGGLPSSGALRKDLALLHKLNKFYSNPQHRHKVLASIGSGTEVLISSGSYFYFYFQI